MGVKRFGADDDDTAGLLDFLATGGVEVYQPDSPRLGFVIGKLPVFAI